MQGFLWTGGSASGYASSCPRTRCSPSESAWKRSLRSWHAGRHPVSRLHQSEAQKPFSTQPQPHERVVGQNTAVDAVATLSHYRPVRVLAFPPTVNAVSFFLFRSPLASANRARSVLAAPS
jgi:hypothetical protein